MDWPSRVRKGLLVELDQALATTPELVPLPEARFLETHVLYEGRSNQQECIIDWFASAVPGWIAPDRPYRVMSVGCGSGILDVPVARHLAAVAPALDYVGIDPNLVECDVFRGRFSDADLPAHVTLDVSATTFERYVTSAPFDLVHLVHCLYYLPDAAAALLKAQSLLGPGGRLVVVHAPCGALNDLATRFYDKGYGRPTLFAEDCADLLDRWGWRYVRSRIDARVDVTPMWMGDPEVGLALRDFIVQFDSERLPRDVQRLVDRYLRAIADPTPEGPVFIDHPVDVFVIDGP